MSGMRFAAGEYSGGGIMEIKRVRCGPVVTNCYILFGSGNNAVVVDPGFNAEKIDRELGGSRVEYVVLTHAHFDHVYETDFFRRKYGAKSIILDKELPSLKDERIVMPFTRPVEGYSLRHYTADILVSDGEEITLAGKTFRVIHTPGHTPGSMCLYCPEAKILISGDTLFRGSVGRTDFPYGSSEDMRHSIARLMSLPDDTQVLPGHGFHTTIGEERANNPFVCGEQR